MSLGVLFDVDGTLVTFRFDVQGSRKALLEELGKRGFDIGGLGLSSPTQHVLDAARRQMDDGTVRGSFDDIRKSLFSILDRFELESGESVTVFPEAEGILRELRSRSVKLAVLTNSGRLAADRIMERSSLGGYFDFVLTRDDVEAMKPRPEGVEMAVSLFSLPKESVVYVGDSLLDIMAAKAAGLKVISVATGNYPAERLRSEGADVVVASLSEIAKALPL